MPGHTHNCLTLPTGECSGALRSCLALLGNAVTPLSLFSLSHSHFFPPLHSHYFASHSHFPFSCSVGFFSFCFSVFARCNEGVLSLVLLGNAVTPLSLFLFHTLTFFLHYTLTFFASHSHFPLSSSVGLFSLYFSLFLLGAMRASSPWSSWGMLSPHSHFFASHFHFSFSCFVCLLC